MIHPQRYFRAVATQSLPFRLALGYFFMAQILLFVWSRPVLEILAAKNYPDPRTPDTRYGYTCVELKELYQVLGDEGRTGYVWIAIVDLLGYIPGYVTLGGAFMGRRYPFVLFAAVIDVIETTSQAYNAAYFEDGWNASVCRVGSVANFVKWSAGIVCVIVAFLDRNRLPERAHVD